MSVTMETWKRFSGVMRVEPARPRKDAEKVRRDAQDFDNVSEDAGQLPSAKNIAGLRVQNWPQFFVLWQIIGCISAYDSFLAMKYRGELIGPDGTGMEQNELGRLLLSLDGGDPALFLGVKFLGTIMVLGILANLYHSRPQWGLAVARGVATFQMLLLAYLTVG